MKLIAQTTGVSSGISGSIFQGSLFDLIQMAKRQFSVICGPAILFIVLELIDGILTMWATQNGFVEVNPLVSPYSQTWLCPASKVATAMLGSIVLLPAVRRHSRLIKAGFILASLFIAVIILSNLYEIVLAA